MAVKPLRFKDRFFVFKVKKWDRLLVLLKTFAKIYYLCIKMKFLHKLTLKMLTSI